jgi:hypothetical protein
MNSAREILDLFPMNVRSHPHPLLSLKAELSVTPPLLFGSLAASQLARRPLGFAPPPHGGFAFLASAQGCACKPTSLPTGAKFATVFEVVSVFFSTFFLFYEPFWE